MDGMLDHVRRLRRSARVLRTGAGVYLGYKRTQRRARGMPPEAAEAAWLARHEQVAEKFYRTAVDLKGLYIKTGQFIGTRSDLVPEPFVRSLARLQDAVPARPAREIRATVEAELGRPIDELFQRFDDEPLAAASLAQVHRARTHGGREVAVKVQYREVRDLVRLDLRNLRTLSNLVARREPNFDYRTVVKELGAQMPLELDFRREAEMTRRVQANLAALPGIVVPDVIDGLLSERVLVTGFVEGGRLLDVARPGEHGAALAATITSAYGHQILLDGLFQADPHPGNLLVTPGGDVALLDFGLTKELPGASRMGFARLVAASARRDPGGVVRAFEELGVRTRSGEPEDMLNLMRLFLDARTAGAGGGPDPGMGRRSVLNRAPVDAIPGDLVLLGRVVGLLRGVCASLGSPVTPMQMLLPYAERALAAESAGEAAS